LLLELEQEGGGISLVVVVLVDIGQLLVLL
jgi:hypothetical protein